MMRILWLFLLLFCSVASARQVIDISGRQVTLPDTPQRIVLGESRMLYTLALLLPDNPAARIVGWPADLKKYDPQSWAQYAARFPALARIPQLGSGSVRDMNPEAVLQLRPDLVILPQLAKSGEQEAHFMQVMAQAGVPVVKVDLRVDLLHHTVPSVKLLGDIFGQPARAANFIDFYQTHMARIRQRLASYHGEKTRVMLQLHLGRRDTCCTTAVNGNLGQLLAFAGGDNIAAASVRGVFGELNPERALAAKPQVYIATGMAGGSADETLALGPQVSESDARSSLRRQLAAQPLLSQLAAVRNGRTFGLWHNFYLSPYHVVAAEWMAKALYPELFADVDPQQTLQQLYQRFLPLDFTGTFWVALHNEKNLHTDPRPAAAGGTGGRDAGRQPAG